MSEKRNVLRAWRVWENCFYQALYVSSVAFGSNTNKAKKRLIRRIGRHFFFVELVVVVGKAAAAVVCRVCKL